MASVHDSVTWLKSQSVQKMLDTLYPAEKQHNSQIRYQKLISDFFKCFPEHNTFRCFRAPGRTEIAGNHTDHQHGQVLCAAIDLDIIAAAAPNGRSLIRLQSEGFPSMDQINLDQLDPVSDEKNQSAALIRGVAAAFKLKGFPVQGFDVYTSSRIPRGSGLSSSAAFEVLLATIMDAFASNSSLSPLERAQIAQHAENVYFGKPSGLMDQCACSFGGFLKIDFRQPDNPLIESIDFNWEHFGYALVITDTGASHDQLTDDYASITRDMAQIARYFNVSVLRDVDPARFFSQLGVLRASFPERTLLRAMHFFEDNQRIDHQTDALRRLDMETFLKAVRASGYSSRTQLQNVYSDKRPSVQPLSLALSLSDHLLAGSGASRVHGGGFAGTIQAYVPHQQLNHYCKTMRSVFGADACMRVRVCPTGSVEVF